MWIKVLDHFVINAIFVFTVKFAQNHFRILVYAKEYCAHHEAGPVGFMNALLAF